MNRNPILLACLAGVSGLAAAQSSVTLSGAVDVSAKYVKADGQPRRVSEGIDGLNSSELVVKGTEDLGGGLRAGFKLSASLSADTGTTAAKFWGRQSYVNLTGRFGEVRLGRDYTPTFWSQAIYDSFGFVGIGADVNGRQLFSGARMDNSIGYLLPANLGGVFGQVMVAASEGGTTADRPARYVGARLGYGAGPFEIAFSAAEQRFAGAFTAGTNGLSAAANLVPGDKQKTYNLAGSWDFGVAKIKGYFDRESVGTFRENVASVSAIIPLGVSEIHAGYERSTLKNSAASVSTTVDLIKASYVYNLSKRTAVYGTVSRLDNKDGTRLTLPGNAGPTTVGGKSQGAEVGLRHFF